jgi:hypothetical protein
VERVRRGFVCASAVVAIIAPSATIARARVRVSRILIHASNTSARQSPMAVNGVGTARLEHLDIAPHSTHVVEDSTFPATRMPANLLVMRITR